MITLITTEFSKMKRYYTLWVGIILMLFAVLLTLFTSTAQTDDVWTFSFLSEQVIITALQYTSPACIALILGQTIQREKLDDTLKNLVTVPVSTGKLLSAKLIACSLLFLVLGALCGVFTIFGCVMTGMPGVTFIGGMNTILNLSLFHFFLFWSIAAVVLFVYALSREPMIGTVMAFIAGYMSLYVLGIHNSMVYSAYPFTACLGLIRFRAAELDADAAWKLPLCIASFIRFHDLRNPLSELVLGDIRHRAKRVLEDEDRVRQELTDSKAKQGAQ